MSFWEIFLLAVGVSMDAFAVSLGKGMSVSKVNFRQVLSVGLWFGGFQALMPVLGYCLGTSFSRHVDKLDHWAAFVLLGLIGVKMILDSLRHEDAPHNASFGLAAMFLLAVATSIDALAVGVSFAFLEVNLWSSVLIIGVTTFVFSAAGLILGSRAGTRLHKKAEIFGGVLLISIGIKILLEHLFQ